MLNRFLMNLHPLGDQAVLAYLPEESAAIRLAGAVRSVTPPWLQDIVPAYTSVGFFFDADMIGLSDVIKWLNEFSASIDTQASPGTSQTSMSSRTICIPVCYEMQSDMARVCDQTGLSADDVVRLHTSTDFTVYAIGFMPGFPYLGYLPPKLCGVGRLSSPRLSVEAGSVGLAGRQTGIYPLPSPGGWNLIGRTPRVIVDVAAGFFPLRVGDKVRFERIDERQFREEEGERLTAES